jgi:hypothetical protein
MSKIYQLTFFYADIRDDETEQKILKLTEFLGGQKNNDNSDDGQLSVFVQGISDMHDLVDAGLTYEAIANVGVEMLEVEIVEEEI